MNALSRRDRNASWVRRARARADAFAGTPVGARVAGVVRFLPYLFIALVLSAPLVFATIWDSFIYYYEKTREGFGGGDALDGLVGLLQVSLLIVPVLGLVLTLAVIGKKLGAAAWRWSEGRPALRAGLTSVRFGLTSAAVVAVGVGLFTWLPTGGGATTDGDSTLSEALRKASGGVATLLAPDEDEETASSNPVSTVRAALADVVGSESSRAEESPAAPPARPDASTARSTGPGQAARPSGEQASSSLPRSDDTPPPAAAPAPSNPAPASAPAPSGPAPAAPAPDSSPAAPADPAPAEPAPAAPVPADPAPAPAPAPTPPPGGQAPTLPAPTTPPAEPAPEPPPEPAPDPEPSPPPGPTPDEDYPEPEPPGDEPDDKSPSTPPTAPSEGGNSSEEEEEEDPGPIPAGIPLAEDVPTPALPPAPRTTPVLTR